MLKRRIDDVIVVEGVHDAQKLQSFYDVDVLWTNGSAVSNEFLEKLVSIAENREVIVFTDPDYPGMQIRSKVSQVLPRVKHAYIEKRDALGKGKVGVEHATFEVIDTALSHVVVFNKQNIKHSISWNEYIAAGFVVGSEAKNKRKKIQSHFHLGKSNTKQLYKQLVMLGVSYDQLQMIINE